MVRPQKENAILPPQLWVLADLYDLELAAKQAEVLSPVSAEIFEEALKLNSLDLVNRARLLGFYYRLYWKRLTPRYRKFRENRTRHILWFIQNMPQCRFAGDLYFYINKLSDRDNYASVEAAWTNALRRTGDLQVRINAALFQYKHDQDKCRKLLSEVLLRSPQNAWADALMHRLPRDGGYVSAVPPLSGLLKDIP